MVLLAITTSFVVVVTVCSHQSSHNGESALSCPRSSSSMYGSVGYTSEMGFFRIEMHKDILGIEQKVGLLLVEFWLFCV